MGRVRIDLTLDEAYERMHRTGPEFDGWLTNHGPMAADAMLRLGHGDQLAAWLERYTGRLEDAPTARWRIPPADWLEYLGDPSRLGDWTEFFTHRLQEAPWQHVLSLWWPRLLPGSIAASTHGLIRTGHAVRALLDQQTGPRLDELADALGYWAARWQALPRGERPLRPDPAPPPSQSPSRHCGSTPAAARLATSRTDDWAALLASAPRLALTGGARARLHLLDTSQRWAAFLDHAEPRTHAPAEDVPSAIDGVVDAAVSSYAASAHGNPVMLVHAATAPRAARLCLPALPRELWPSTLQWAWRTSATITALYRPDGPTTATRPHSTGSVADASLADRAARHGDEHVIKFTEVALESSRRGHLDAVNAVEAALARVPRTG